MLIPRTSYSILLGDDSKRLDYNQARIDSGLREWNKLFEPLRIQDLAIAKTPFSTGFRLHKQLRSLMQAHALYWGRSKVLKEDSEEIRRLSKFLNVDFHKI